MNFASKGVGACLVMLSLVSHSCRAEDLPATAPGKANPAGDEVNLWITPGIFSHHFDRNAGYRERNWGFGVQSNLSESVSVMAGNYINSDNDRSDYAGFIWQPWSWHSIKMGLAAAAFNGYPLMLNGGWFPAILPVLSIRNERVGVNLTAIPSYASRGLHGSVAAQFILRVW